MKSVIEAPHPSVMPRGYDPGLLPTWQRRLAIALYVATAACVGLSACLWRERRWDSGGGSWAADWFGWSIVAYCVAYAIGLHRARPAWVGLRADLRAYGAVFGDGPPATAPKHAYGRSHTAVLVPFLLHATCGLMAGGEMALAQLRTDADGYTEHPRELALVVGFVGLILGWLPTVVLANAAEKCGWLVLVGVLGPLVIFFPLLIL